MFAAVTFLPCCHNYQRFGFLERFLAPKPRLFEISNGAISILDIESSLDSRGQPRWNRILSFARKNGINKYLLPAGMPCPEAVKPMICSPEQYLRNYCLRMSVKAAKDAGLVLSELDTAILDTNGYSNGHLAAEAIPIFRSVTIYTQKEWKYEFFWSLLADDRKDSLKYTQNQDGLARCHIILAPYGVEGFDPHGLPGLTVSAKPVPESWEGPVIDGFEPEIPEILESIRPPEIDKLAFAAALWQHAELAPLDSLPLVRCLSRGDPIDCDLITSGLSRLDS